MLGYLKTIISSVKLQSQLVLKFYQNLTLLFSYNFSFMNNLCRSLKLKKEPLERIFPHLKLYESCLTIMALLRKIS